MNRTKPRTGNHCDLYRDLYKQEVLKNIKLQAELKAANERIIELKKEIPEWLLTNTEEEV